MLPTPIVQSKVVIAAGTLLVIAGEHAVYPAVKGNGMLTHRSCIIEELEGHYSGQFSQQSQGQEILQGIHLLSVQVQSLRKCVTWVWHLARVASALGRSLAKRQLPLFLLSLQKLRLATNSHSFN